VSARGRVFGAIVSACALSTIGAAAVSARAASVATVQAWLTTADASSQLTQQPAVKLGPVARGQVNVSLDDSRGFQTITGPGAAFTDSSTYLTVTDGSGKVTSASYKLDN
jgi:glucosylceramidase